MHDEKIEDRKTAKMMVGLIDAGMSTKDPDRVATVGFM